MRCLVVLIVFACTQSCFAQDDFLDRLVKSGYRIGENAATQAKEDAAKMAARKTENIESLEALRDYIRRNSRTNRRAEETTVNVMDFVKSGPLPNDSDEEDSVEYDEFGRALAPVKRKPNDFSDRLPEVVWFKDSRSRRDKLNEIDLLIDTLKSDTSAERTAKWIMRSFNIIPRLGVRTMSDNYGQIGRLDIRVLQVVSDGTFLAQFGENVPNNIVFLVRGYKEQVVDDQRILLEGVFADCTETYSYDNAGGSSSTVRVVELYDSKLVTDYIEKHVPDNDMRPPSPPEEKKSEPKPLVSRTWTDTTGNFSVEATFVSNKDGIVTLRKQDGSLIVLPVVKLSAADQTWLKDRTGQ